MENILVLDGLCTWRGFSRLLLTGAATVLALAGSLGIAKGSPVVGCPSSPITLAMASQLDVPGGFCEFTISDFILSPNSEGTIFFTYISSGGPVPTTEFEATNAPIFSTVNGVTTLVGEEAEFCYFSYNAGQCSLEATGPLGSNLGLGPDGFIDFDDQFGQLPFSEASSIHGELSVYLSGTVGGQPATLGLAIYDNPFGPNNALIAIPEPSTYATLGIGVLAIVVFRRKIHRTVL